MYEAYRISTPREEAYVHTYLENHQPGAQMLQLKIQNKF